MPFPITFWSIPGKITPKLLRMFFLKSLAFADRIIILAPSLHLSERKSQKLLKDRMRFYKNTGRIKYLYWETLIVVWLPFRRRKCLFRFITWRREIAATTKPFL